MFQFIKAKYNNFLESDEGKILCRFTFSLFNVSILEDERLFEIVVLGVKDWNTDFDRCLLGFCYWGLKKKIEIDLFWGRITFPLAMEK